MALPTPSRLTRAVPSGGTTEDVRGIAIDDEVEGGGSAKLATIVQYPALLWKIAHQISSSNLNKEFPDDDTGVAAAAAGSNTLKLASGVFQTQQATIDPRNLLIEMVSGVAAGQVRLITGWTSATQTVTVNRNWGASAPASGDKYRVLVDLRYRSNLHLTTEYSADAISAAFRIILYDWGIDGASALRKPRRAYDLARTSPYTSIQITAAEDIETTNRWIGETVSVSTRGFLGAKVRLTTAPGAGNVDVFMATT